MEDWVLRGMARWPNVPALYGWLGLDRRGRWLIKGEVISRPQIIDTINCNYAVDARGCWYFQNGPQRGYISLEVAPYLLTVQGDALMTHTGLPVRSASGCYLDEEGSLLLQTEHGPAQLLSQDLDWALPRLLRDGVAIDEPALSAALALPGGSDTGCCLALGQLQLPVLRLNRADVEATLGFVRQPQA